MERLFLHVSITLDPVMTLKWLCLCLRLSLKELEIMLIKVSLDKEIYTINWLVLSRKKLEEILPLVFDVS
jgi:hypothetical protein